jgi:hypothetical protein
MARIRYLKPDFFKDDDVAGLPFEFRLLYQGLWCLADKAGRLEDRSLRIKAEIFPYDDVDIEKGLCVLAQTKPSSKQPFINRYQADSQRYIQIVRWEHQKPHHTEAESKIPPDTPLKEKGKEKGKGNQLNPSLRLTDGVITVNFATFWGIYPKKVSKAVALKVFHKINPNAALFERILEAVKEQRCSEQWTKDGGQFIPHAST